MESKIIGLVVDDDEASREYAKLNLNRRGEIPESNIKEASNADEAKSEIDKIIAEAQNGTEIQVILILDGSFPNNNSVEGYQVVLQYIKLNTQTSVSWFLICNSGDYHCNTGMQEIAKKIPMTILSGTGKIDPSNITDGLQEFKRLAIL